MGKLEPLSAGNAPEALAYLAERPYDTVYVTWLLATGQIARDGDAVLWRSGSGRVTGFCYYGPQIVVPQSDDAEAPPAFAERAGRAPAARMIVGPRPGVEQFWARASATMRPPVAIRTSQPVYALERSRLRGSRADADVQLATAGDLSDIVPNSARMIAGEIGGDPKSSSPEFRLRTARIIDAGWWWRYRVDGKLAFMCNVGSASPFTAQLQGVWTPPEMRGKGYATRALAAICDRLLDEHPTLSLYVNDFNLPAIALYERVGFTRAGEFATILF
jgi:RimJ/RimL family protein N-acetyltransferase